jgi:hypothetical protein
MKQIILLTFFFTPLVVDAQLKLGITYGGDTYQQYTNPKVSGDSLSRSSGNALLNIALGPKLWLKHCNYSISFESQINWGITSFSIRENKGTGTLSIPIVAKFNTGTLEGYNNIDKLEYSYGLGIQFNRTELSGFKDKYKNNPPREYFKTYIAEFGIHSTNKIFPEITYMYVRVGLAENRASSFNLGIMFDKVF